MCSICCVQHPFFSAFCFSQNLTPIADSSKLSKSKIHTQINSTSLYSSIYYNFHLHSNTTHSLSQRVQIAFSFTCIHYELVSGKSNETKIWNKLKEAKRIRNTFYMIYGIEMYYAVHEWANKSLECMNDSLNELEWVGIGMNQNACRWAVSELMDTIFTRFLSSYEFDMQWLLEMYLKYTFSFIIQKNSLNNCLFSLSVEWWEG